MFFRGFAHVHILGTYVPFLVGASEKVKMYLYYIILLYNIIDLELLLCDPFFIELSGPIFGLLKFPNTHNPCCYRFHFMLISLLFYS